jgi:hydroxyacylglutathione hydrolase
VDRVCSTSVVNARSAGGVRVPLVQHYPAGERRRQDDHQYEHGNRAPPAQPGLAGGTTLLLTQGTGPSELAAPPPLRHHARESRTWPRARQELPRAGRERLGRLREFVCSSRSSAGQEHGPVLIAGFPAGPWGTNCYVVATGPGAECVVVDPGKDAAPGVAEVVREHRLKPVSVLVSHGHVDHMWCVAPVAGTYDATAWIHPNDRHLLSDPMAGMSRDTAAMVLGGGYQFAEPDDVAELEDLQRLQLAGLDFVVDHTPGHTEGSVTFRTPYDEEDVSEVMFSGDLLFAGSIGRTDLPGGDHPTMLRSLRDKVLPLADDVVVLPGHGEQTSIGQERATNPYLRGLGRGAETSSARRRGL